MARTSGHWRAYLRFAYRGKVRVLHLLCDNRAQPDQALPLLKRNLPDGGRVGRVRHLPLGPSVGALIFQPDVSPGGRTR
jgi:hypothetical protein